ncbi:MAG: hypothetical protein NZO58_13945 [Gemmataceae bacterium]|nr:hypothetical protein [Gemmataceae bacterium]
MKATIVWFAAFASACWLTGSAAAQYHPLPGQAYAPVSKQPLGHAPNTCQPGFYVVNPAGQIIGPNYYLRPCFGPFQGVLPNVYELEQLAGRREAQYPYHPFARSPRDFFMFRENLEEELRRQQRPSLVP